MSEQTIDYTSAPEIIDLFDGAAAAMTASPCRSGSIVRLPATGRLLATGDLHDNTEHLRKVLKLAKLEASTDHHVILHELIHGEHLINGMDFSHRMLARIAGLVTERPEQVHPLLANHELSQLTRRGVSKGAGNSVELFNESLHYVFHRDSDDVAAAIDRFIRAMPLALLSESGVLCAHSLPAARTIHKFDRGIIERELVNEDYHYPDGAAYLMVWGRNHGEDEYRALAEAWGVKLFILGHQHVETGIELKWSAPAPGNGPVVIILNSDHERATVLPIDLANPPPAEEALLAAVPLASVG